MTKSEAKQAMSENKKVTHIYFEPYEWVTMIPNSDYVIMEDGNSIHSKIFWSDRSHDCFNTDWSIKE